MLWVTLWKQLLELCDLGRVDFLKSVDSFNGCLEGLLDDLELLKTFLQLLDFEIECFLCYGLIFRTHLVSNFIIK